MGTVDRSIATAQVPEEAEATPDTVLHGWWLAAAWVAWVAIVALVAVVLGAIVTLTPGEPLGEEDDVAGLVFVVLQFVLFFGAAALILRRRYNVWMGLLVALALITLPMTLTGGDDAAFRAANPAWRIPHALRDAFGGFTWIVLLFYVFPNGRFVPGFTRFLAIAWVGGLVVFSLLVPEPIVEYPALIVVLVAFVASGMLAQGYRFFRVSGPVERQQVKWVALGLTGTFFGAIFWWVATFVIEPSFQSVPSWVEEVVFQIVGYRGFLFPMSLLIAVLRYRLWDIDILVNRTLVYGSLTASLAATYVAGIVLLQLAFRGVTAQAGPVAFVISTLAIGALFQPLRRRIQNIIDRRLYRRKYDAFRTLEALSVRMRDEVDLSRLNDELLAAIRETVQPSHVSLRLLETADAEESGWIKVHFQTNPDLVEIDTLDSDSPAVQALRAAGTRIAVPLLSQGELVGLINLGPRLSGQDYSTDDRKLLSNMATQAAPAVRVAQLVRQREAETQERERTKQELRIARVIQQTLLPKELPKLSGWQVAAHYQPARAVGGDFYDFIGLPNDKLGIVIGDVTDKGMPAAMVMATTRSLLRPTAQRLTSPGPVLELVNDLLYPDIPSNMFVTCLYLVLSPSSGRIRYANAGHDVPYGRTAKGVVEFRATGMPLGSMPGMSYQEMETTIAPGDSVLFYSDGLTEAHNTSREMFGSPRAKELVAAHPGGATLIHHLLAELAGFTGEDWEQEDDVTLVTLERNP